MCGNVAGRRVGTVFGKLLVLILLCKLKCSYLSALLQFGEKRKGLHWGSKLVRDNKGLTLSTKLHSQRAKGDATHMKPFICIFPCMAICGMSAMYIIQTTNYQHFYEIPTIHCIFAWITNHIPDAPALLRTKAEFLPQKTCFVSPDPLSTPLSNHLSGSAKTA